MPWWNSGRNLPHSSSGACERDMSLPNRFGRHRQLTRQRKLRHLRDEDLVGLARDTNSANYIARKQSSPENCQGRSSTSMPQPLPLPDPGPGRRNPQAGRRPNSADSGEGNVSANVNGNGNGHRPRPRHTPVDLSPLLVEPVGERFQTPPVLWSRIPPQPATRKSPDHSDGTLGGLKYGIYRNGFYDANILEDCQFRFAAVERSGLSSPGISPGRSSNGDLFPCSCPSSQVPHMWSAPEFPSSSDFFSGHERSSYSYSPIVKSPGPRNPSAPCSPLHSKLFKENSPVRHENHGSANVHPLPLPPGAQLSLQPSFAHKAQKTEPPSLPNQWLKGKLIGSGTFGNVYIATNRQTGALCAMKEVNLIPDDPKSAECIKQLQQEIKVLSHLKHPNIVQYYGSEVIEDRFYIYLEYVYPGSINKYVNEHCGAVTESVVRNFTRHILNGLAYLHSTKTMHRDIKGANLLVDSSGVVKLADFGMAKHLSGAKDVLSMKGTPYWMAPEVLQATVNNELSYNLGIDIWSLGCTIIEMFTGKHPWSGFESAAAMFKVLQESPPIPETLSAEGKDFLQLCFRRDPTERPTASQLLEHPFVVNTIQHDLHGSVQALAGMKLCEAPHGPKNTMFTFDSTMKGKYSFNEYSGF